MSNTVPQKKTRPVIPYTYTSINDFWEKKKERDTMARMVERSDNTKPIHFYLVDTATTPPSYLYKDCPERDPTIPDHAYNEHMGLMYLTEKYGNTNVSQTSSMVPYIYTSLQDWKVKKKERQTMHKMITTLISKGKLTHPIPSFLLDTSDCPPNYLLQQHEQTQPKKNLTPTPCSTHTTVSTANTNVKTLEQIFEDFVKRLFPETFLQSFSVKTILLKEVIVNWNVGNTNVPFEGFSFHVDSTSISKYTSVFYKHDIDMFLQNTKPHKIQSPTLVTNMTVDDLSSDWKQALYVYNKHTRNVISESKDLKLSDIQQHLYYKFCTQLLLCAHRFETQCFEYKNAVFMLDVLQQILCQKQLLEDNTLSNMLKAQCVVGDLISFKGTYARHKATQLIPDIHPCNDVIKSLRNVRLSILEFECRFKEFFTEYNQLRNQFHYSFLTMVNVKLSNMNKSNVNQHKTLTTNVLLLNRRIQKFIDALGQTKQPNQLPTQHRVIDDVFISRIGEACKGTAQKLLVKTCYAFQHIQDEIKLKKKTIDQLSLILFNIDKLIPIIFKQVRKDYNECLNACKKN